MIAKVLPTPTREHRPIQVFCKLDLDMQIEVLVDCSVPDGRRSDRQLSFDLELPPRWGGRRAGAGRPPGTRPRVPHRARVRFPGSCPAHVTLRVRPDVPSLRSRNFVREFQRALRVSCERGAFRVLHYSLQRDHAHLVVEAEGKNELARGMKSVAARLALTVNRVFGRSGPVLDGRYHLHVLRTPREVRNAFAYVFLNARRHWVKKTGTAPPVRIDEASSGRWFTGWSRRAPAPAEKEGREVGYARTWLARVGWKRHGLVDPAAVPGTDLRP